MPWEDQELRFNGSHYDPAMDNARLGKQFRRIFALMQDGKPRTLREIEEATGYPQASISAQLRHMRKARFGGHTLLTKSVGGGLFVYTLIVNQLTLTTCET